MINYWSQTISLASAEESVAQAERNYQSVLTKRAAGMAVQSAEQTAAESVTTTKSSLESAKTNLETTKKSLGILLGWKYEDDFEIGELPDPDLSMIDAIDVEADIQTALSNNYNLQITAKRITNAQSSSIRETQQKTYDNQKETASTSVKNAYNSLILAKSSYEQALASYELQKSELAAAETRYAAGTITKNTYEQQKSSCSNAEVSAKTQKLNLLKAQLEYTWAVAGLASTQ
jgi:outer membrane protein TolC